MDKYFKTAFLIKNSLSALFLTGAGMSADSGIPTYRDTNGFWTKSHPLRINPYHLATEQAFINTPELAWGFFEWKRRKIGGNLPHSGYTVINRWMKNYIQNSFIHTTNVDGYHEKSGGCTKDIYETHGSIWRLQCSNLDCREISFNEKKEMVKLHYDTLKSQSPFPICPKCFHPTRPNILLFKDFNYIPLQEQLRHWSYFIEQNSKIDLVFLIGCGRKIPVNETIARSLKTNGSEIIVINPDPHSFRLKPSIYFQAPAQETLERINDILENDSSEISS